MRSRAEEILRSNETVNLKQALRHYPNFLKMTALRRLGAGGDTTSVPHKANVAEKDKCCKLRR